MDALFEHFEFFDGLYVGNLEALDIQSVRLVLSCLSFDQFNGDWNLTHALLSIIGL